MIDFILVLSFLFFRSCYFVLVILFLLFRVILFLLFHCCSFVVVLSVSVWTQPSRVDRTERPPSRRHLRAGRCHRGRLAELERRRAQRPRPQRRLRGVSHVRRPLERRRLLEKQPEVRLCWLYSFSYVVIWLQRIVYFLYFIFIYLLYFICWKTFTNNE